MAVKLNPGPATGADFSIPPHAGRRSGGVDFIKAPISRGTVIEPINKLLDSVDFDAVFYSLDWHPSDHVSFIDNIKQRPIHPTSPLNADNAQVYDTVIFAGPPPMKQRLWPRHCVQDSWGSELHKDLKVLEHGVKVYKGTNPEVDSYSVFWDNKKLSDTTLCAQLRLKGSTDIYVCGLAYDVCVGATAIDALSAGYRTILIDDCCRGVDLNDIESTKQTVISSNGVIVSSREVKAMVEGRDRRPELGYKLAMELKNSESDLSKNNACRRQSQHQQQQQQQPSHTFEPPVVTRAGEFGLCWDEPPNRRERVTDGHHSLSSTLPNGTAARLMDVTAGRREHRRGRRATDVESVNYTLSFRELASNNLPNPHPTPSRGHEGTCAADHVCWAMLRFMVGYWN
ncbi:AGAP001435-PA-like protein [Anopheles sinensis]|uniref:nicotinamidase n=1 Tax=Anopheles sinensis TaxID=74873 RepID=A0A084VTU6_ANOSI|nr:AGAP001435-PA-like protein [Anopheles sinensis]